jgi:acyl-coenzyme A thioesterase PaaI-like protein
LASTTPGDRAIGRRRYCGGAVHARLLDAADPAAGVTFQVGELAGNGFGGLHAASLSAMFEVAGYLSLLPALTAAEHALTHSISVQLVAAARDGELVDVRGSVDRRTRRLAFVSVVASVGDRMIGRAQLTKSIVEFR